jgi:AcrR family transcriptional regulator
MNAANTRAAAAVADGQRPAGYRRSAGSPRGEARRRELLDRVADDLEANGLADFSLRRAARAAGTTHKVLLYHFDGAEDLLRQALAQLRERRIANVMDAATTAPAGDTLADRVRAIWPVLMADDSGVRVLDQGMGLAVYDPARYASLVREAEEQYLPRIRSLCPEHWDEQRKAEVAALIYAVFRGFLVDWVSTRDMSTISAGLAALVRALEHEEAVP